MCGPQLINVAPASGGVPTRRNCDPNNFSGRMQPARLPSSSRSRGHTPIQFILYIVKEVVIPVRHRP